MAQRSSESSEDQVESSSFEDLLVQQATLNRQIALEHDRIVSKLRIELEQSRACLDKSSRCESPRGSQASNNKATKNLAWSPNDSPPAPPSSGLHKPPPPLQPELSSASPALSVTTMSPTRNDEAQVMKVVSLPHEVTAEVAGEADKSMVEHKISDNSKSEWSMQVPPTTQLLNTQGFKRHKMKCETEPANKASEEASHTSPKGHISFEASTKRLHLPGKVGNGAAKDPDSSSSSSSDNDGVVAKSLSWCPVPSGDASSRKVSLHSLNPLNIFFKKDEDADFGRKMSITVAQTDDTEPADKNLQSVTPMEPAAPRRHSLSATNVNGSRRPSMAGGRGSRRQSRNLSANAANAPPLVKTKFEPYQVWSSALDNQNQETWERISNISRHSVLVDAYRKLRSVDFHKHGGSDGFCSFMLQKMVMHPSSLKRMLWVALSGILITYDLIMTPLRVFDFEDTIGIQVLNWITMFFWTLDMLMSPFVGYHYQFNLEMRVKHTALHYLRSWFAFDFLLVSSDWILVIFGQLMGDKGVEGARTLRTAKTFRMARALRSLRLLRVVKMPEIMKDATYLFGRSEYTSLTLGILKHVSCILMVNHVIACVWYLLGDVGRGWVREYCQNCSVEMLYFTSLHWSLTQFTPATMAVQPQNFHERLFAVSVLLFALITFSSFVSSITNLMTHLRTLRSVEAKQYVKLERYLHDRGISFHLSIRVRRYLEHVMNERARYLEEADVELLKKLSTPLHMELRYEVHSPVLSKHPFFYHLSFSSLQVMQRLCLEALKCVHVGAGDSLFGVGDSAQSMYFVERGILLYSKQAAFTPKASPEMIESGNWCCEAVLWTPWEHRGEMRALTEAILLALLASKFHEIMSKNKTAAQQPAVYAVEVVDALNKLERQDLSDLDNREQAADKVNMVKEAFEVEESDDEVNESTQSPGTFANKVLHRMANTVTVTMHQKDRSSLLRANTRSSRTSDPKTSQRSVSPKGSEGDV